MVADILAPIIFLAFSLGRVGCLFDGDDHGKLVASAFPEEQRKMLLDGTAYYQNGVLKWTFRKQLHAVEIDPPWYAVSFPQSANVQFDLVDLPLYPTQAIEIFYNLAIGAGLLLLGRAGKLAHGYLALSGMTLWGGCRFLVEYLRGDVARGINIIGVLSSGQVVALVTIFLCLTVIIARSRSGYPFFNK